MFCRSLLALLSFFLWPLCCLFFFDIRILITPLVSSNSSCEAIIWHLWYLPQITGWYLHVNMQHIFILWLFFLLLTIPVECSFFPTRLPWRQDINKSNTFCGIYKVFEIMEFHFKWEGHFLKVSYFCKIMSNSRVHFNV